LQKALNSIGDDRLAVPCNTLKWAINAHANIGTGLSGANTYPEYDYTYSPVLWTGGSLNVVQVSTSLNAFSGTMGSCCFVMAIDLETSNGGEIAGLNAEEQSDISLIARWSGAQNTSFVFDVYTYIDSMIVLRENNVSIFLKIGFGIDPVIPNCVFLIKMGFSNDLEYLEIAVDSTSANASGGSLWVGSASPANQISFSWPKFYWTFKNPALVGLQVISAEIPNVWDVINTLNNTLIYTISGVPTTITLATGTYTGAQIATALQTAISAVTAGFTVTYDSTNFKFTFTQTVSANPWTISFTSTKSLYSILGFLPVSSQGGTGAGTSTASTVVANVTGAYYLYLNSRTLGPLINFNLTEDATLGNGGPQIARIPVNANRGSVCFYTNPTPDYFFDCFADSLNQFDLYLTLGSDQLQIPLDMKGVPWSVKFGILAKRGAAPDLYHKPVRGGIQTIQ